MYEYGLSRRLFDNGKVLSINTFYRILTIMLMATCGTIRLARAQDTPLRAGDANQDGLVENVDLVQVLQAVKYLTGLPATWG